MRTKQERAAVQLRWALLTIVGLVVATILTVYASYGSEYLKDEVMLHAENWGQVGDYFGGMLNPILAFASFIALLTTIYIQTQALEASREELKMTRIELKGSKEQAERSADALIAQADHLETQAKKDELFKMITYVFGELNKIFDEKRTPFMFLDSDDEPVRTSRCLTDVFGDKRRNTYNQDLMPPVIFEQNRDKYFRPLISLISELSTYLRLYDELPGMTGQLTNYYKIRYLDIVNDMYNSHYIGEATHKGFL